MILKRSMVFLRLFALLLCRNSTLLKIRWTERPLQFTVREKAFDTLLSFSKRCLHKWAFLWLQICWKTGNSCGLLLRCVCVCHGVFVCRRRWSEARSWVNSRRKPSVWSLRPRRTLRRHTSSRWSTRTRSGTSSDTDTCSQRQTDRQTETVTVRHRYSNTWTNAERCEWVIFTCRSRVTLGYVTSSSSEYLLMDK